MARFGSSISLGQGHFELTESGFQSPHLHAQFCHLSQQYLILSHFGGKLSFQVFGVLLPRMKLLDLKTSPIGERLFLVNRLCSGLMYPDTNLGENARHGEVFDEQAKTYIFP